jgi:ABC-type amino acid transport substrate-binding protein
MRPTIRRLGLLLFALALIVAACGDDDAESSAEVPTKEPGKLILVTTGNFPPFTMISETGEVQGYSIDLGKEIADRLGLELETPTVDWSAELQGLASGLYDIADSGVWPTQERQDQGFLFSRPVTSTGFVAEVAVGNENMAGLDDLSGMKVGAVQGSTREMWLIEEEATLGYDEYLGFAGAAEARQALQQGRIDLIVADPLVTGYYIATNPDEVAFAGPTTHEHPLSLVFQAGKTELQAAVNEVLDEMLADGTIGELQIKWFSRCVPVPNDINAEPPYGEDLIPPGC